MYPVSEAFLQAVQGNTRNYYWTGKITTAAGVEYPFVQEDIVKGSGYITAQCCGNSEIELGAVYAAEMGSSLFLDIDRYTLEGAKVELTYHLQLADGTCEAVPMGIFEVSEANRTAHVLELKAYDYMLRFDRDFNGFETIGTAYGMMALCSTACGVEASVRNDWCFFDAWKRKEGCPMYPVSEAFLQAVQGNTRNYYWTGKITTAAGVEYPFVQEDIVKGSGYITAQCCGNSEIELGAVYAAEMGSSLFLDIDRYTLEGAKVELTYHLQLADGTCEAVPMGIFEVSEANRTAHVLELKAYDYMLRFDRDFNGFETIGTAYGMMALCSTACGVELAQTQAEIEALPNGSELLSIYPENDIETYRDVLYFTAQVLGGFFCINREGKLEFRQYGETPVMEIQQKHRFSSSFSDFVTRYTAVSSTNLRTQTSEYYALDEDNGLTMNLGANPLLQFGLEETRAELCRNILTALSTVNYVPFDSDTIGNPALDLGDVLTFSGGQADAQQITCVTSFTVKIGGRQSLKCVGKNPRLSQAKSKNDKNISGLLNQIEAGKIDIHTFTNASAYTIAETNVRIISIEFASKEENHAQFFGQVVVDVVADTVERTAKASGTIVIPCSSVWKRQGRNFAAISSPLYLRLIMCPLIPIPLAIPRWIWGMF